MPRLSFAAQQTKLQKEIGKLMKQSEQLKSKQRKPVLARIVKDMRDHGITIEEVEKAFGARRTAVRKSKSAARNSTGGRGVAPKYRHPETGETWSGRGRVPRWLAAAEAAGAARESFAIAETTA